MRTHHARDAKALDVQTEPGGEFRGWAGPGVGRGALWAPRLDHRPRRPALG
ncbi:hypothetical protein [Streptomyces swartbergensis]|uniref:hypothetical protein n=1 Tax=Streptomyces swartbergensis TaxID=487165 RepID=UPI0037FAC648